MIQWARSRRDRHACPRRAGTIVSVLWASLIVTLAWVAAATAADCPRKGTLGTSRVLSVDAVTTPRVGLKNFSQTLPLDDHEVVLTFDDGPWPPTTPRVLAALANECGHRTFFLIGNPASEPPDLGRRTAAEGIPSDITPGCIAA